MKSSISKSLPSPLACQLWALLCAFSISRPWSFCREILRASCGQPEPTDAQLDAALKELERKRLLSDSSPGHLDVSSWNPLKAEIFQAAADAFGPLDWGAAFALLGKAERAFGYTQGILHGKLTEWGRKDELKYLRKLNPTDRCAERLDAFVTDFGGFPTYSSTNFLDFSHWPRESLTPALLELQLPFDLERDLEECAPVAGRIDVLAESAARHAFLRCPEMVPHVAPLFVWAGRADLLARYVESLAGNSAAQDAAAFAAGFSGKGWRRMAPRVGAHFLAGGVAQRALVVMLCAKCPPLPVKLEAMLCAIERRSNQRSEALHSLQMLVNGASTAWTNPTLRAVPENASPLDWLGVTLSHALSSSASRRTDFPEAVHALAAAERAAACGWRYLSATLGGLLAQYPDVSVRAFALLADAPADLPLFWNRTEAAKPWDPVLEALGKALEPLRRAARTAPPKKASPEVLVATMRFESFPEGDVPPGVDEGGVALRLREIRPALARALRGGAIAWPDRPCTWRALKKSLHGGALGLPPEAAAALEAWLSRQQSHYGNEVHAMRIDASGRGSFIDVLLRAGDAVRVRFELDGPGGGAEGSVAVDSPDIEPRDLRLETGTADDGSLRIWLAELAWAAREDPLFVRDPDVPSHFVWWRVSPALRPFFAVLEESGGAERRLSVPAGGAEKARAMLEEAVGGGLPVGGAVSADAATGARRVAGAARLCARLDRRDGGALRLALRARPAADAPDLLFSPGRGKSEFAVPRLDEPLVVARSLAAESSAANAVRAALADFEGERDGENDWTVEGPERELALLEALRAASGAAPDGLDVEWRAAPRDRTAVRGVVSARLDGSRGADWWLGVTGSLRLDDGSRVALRDVIESLPRRIGGYVPLGDRTWLRLTTALRRRLEALAASGSLRGAELRVSPAALPMLEEAFSADVGGDGAVSGADGGAEALPPLPAALAEAAGKISAALAAEHPVPDRLQARLRPYQTEGFQWLARLAGCGLGCCLADDMGLGKTVQILALALERAGDGPTLVVAPASVCGNWCSEAARFAPSLNVVRAADSSALPKSLGPGDLVVASYGLLVSREDQFAGVEWNGAVLDEAQAIKNADTQRAESAKRLRAAWRCAATGTPVENRLSDLWSIFDFLNPGLLGSLDSFRARFLDSDGKPLPALRSLVRPLVLRRLKGEVLRDLPPKTEISMAVEPGDAERAAYEALRESLVSRLGAGTESGGGSGGGRMAMLAALTKLRRFCCSPSLAVPGAGTGAKLEALEALLSDLRENGHRALVFSQFTDVLALVKPILERNGWAHEYLDGSTPQNERTRRVEAFQRGSAPFFLVSLKAGGTGLNLTAASYVVLLDPWWNPAVEDQAADRAHRIGQRNAVTVYRLFVRGTVEEKVLALHERKRALSGAVLDGASDSALSEDDLLALLRRD